MNHTEQLLSLLKAHEGWRATVYDDANGKPIAPGSHVVGNPTIGYGWALNVTPMPKALGEIMLRELVQEKAFELDHRLPWISELDPVRRHALYALAYNLGVDGLLNFSRMLAALRAEQWELAGQHLLDSRWAEQVGPTRASAMRQILVTGAWL